MMFYLIITKGEKVDIVLKLKITFVKTTACTLANADSYTALLVSVQANLVAV